MGKITREELWKRIKAGQVEPLYLLHGPEDYLRDRAAQRIADLALEGAPLREFNEATFSLTSVDAVTAVAAANQLPMMASYRVVRIKDFHRLREEGEATIARYIERPSETSIVIFMADELDKRRKLSKTLLEDCTSVEFTHLRDADLASWAKDRLKQLKMYCDERTLRQIIARGGSSVRQLVMELDKLAAAAGDSGYITIEMVDALVPRSREHTNFELTDHLISRNRMRALQTLERLLDDGAEPLMLIGLLASSFHRLALAKDLMTRGAPNEEVFRLVPMPQGRRSDFLATARRADGSELAHRINRIAETDLAIKTSLATPRLQLEMLVCELSS
jgi:DNA polymerase III subunit delta